MDGPECGNENPAFLIFTEKNRDWTDSSESLRKPSIKELTDSDLSQKIDHVDLLVVQSQSVNYGQALPNANIGPELKNPDEEVLYVKAKNSISGELAVLRVTMSRPDSSILVQKMPSGKLRGDASVEISIIDVIEGKTAVCPTLLTVCVIVEKCAPDGPETVSSCAFSDQHRMPPAQVQRQLRRINSRGST